MFKNLFHRKKQEERHDEGIQSYLVYAFNAFENGDYPGAEKYFRMILKVANDHPIARIMIGRIAIESGDYTQAIEAFLDHLHFFPDSVEGLIYLGLTYYQCGEYKHAEERFVEALARGKDIGLIQENIAITRLETGNVTKAIEDLMDLHSRYPDDSNITRLLILALGRAGHWDAAMKYSSGLMPEDMASSVKVNKNP